MGFCSCTTKYILFFFNLACALLGLTVLGVSIYANIQGRSLKTFLEGELNITSILLICVGAAVFLIAFFGCCGAIREDSCYLNTYGVILSILLLAQIALGVLAFVYKSRFPDTFSKYLDETFDKAIHDDKEAIVQMSEIQSTLECCGVTDYNDYTSNHKEIPASCCMNRQQNNSTCPANEAYQKGCKQVATDFIKLILQSLGIISVTVGGVELLGVIFAFCLASSIKRNEMRGYA
ncbi:23 kDa integral membrane protein isoform X1 [Halyomorpha halys]|uniref:23 kDa integral membrane protein isoform X1 n=1 Tax=Halyomorpha halys TaxID=286706 RepID=UPI0006D4EC83|nr:23 kDa integral membrane protein-like isoform X2 [Halyomorpha halys]